MHINDTYTRNTSFVRFTSAPFRTKASKISKEIFSWVSVADSILQRAQNKGVCFHICITKIEFNKDNQYVCIHYSRNWKKDW